MRDGGHEQQQGHSRALWLPAWLDWSICTEQSSRSAPLKASSITPLLIGPVAMAFFSFFFFFFYFQAAVGACWGYQSPARCSHPCQDGRTSEQLEDAPSHTSPGAEPTTAPSLLFPALPLPRFFFFLPHFLPAVQLVAEQKRLDLEEGIHKDLARERRWRHLLESS